MFKLIVTPKAFKLFKVNEGSMNMLAKCTTTVAIIDYVETFCKSIKLGEVDQAIKEMKMNDHNVAEFGINGYFICSYKDETVSNNV